MFLRAALSVFAFVMLICPAAAQQLTIKFSHVVAPDTPKGKAAARFAQLVHQRSGGKIKVEVYANSELYRDKEEMEALQLGAVQMLAPSLAKFAPLGFNEFEVFDLPFLFDDYAELHRVTDGPIGRRLLNKLQDKGIVGLTYWDNGFKHFSANRPLRSVTDFAGLHMRVQASKVLDAQMRALGAIPQAMAFSEVHGALKSGVVDGTENPPSNFFTQRMHEVQKYMLTSAHGYLGYAVIVNQRFWDGLPDDTRKQLTDALEDATRYANNIARQENQAAMAAIKQSGQTEIIALSSEERSRFKRALTKVHRDQETRIGAALLKAIYRETGFDPAPI